MQGTFNMMNKTSLTKAASYFSLFVFCFCIHFVFIVPVMSSNRFQEMKSRAMKFGTSLSPIRPPKITCDRSHNNYDLCSINGPALFDPTTSTVFSIGPTNSTLTPPSLEMKIKPYPRKTDKMAMAQVKKLTLVTSSPPELSCGVTHSSPALVFSTGGYTGNFFHEFMDGLVPLFITTNSQFPDQDVILVITDYHDWWVQKYKKLLLRLTRHSIINVDKETITHCFTSAIVGLISHGHMAIDPKLLPKPKTLVDFQAFLADAYSQDDDDNHNSNSLFHWPNTKPKLIIVNRSAKVGRMILNVGVVEKTAMELGFDVTIFEPNGSTSLADSFRLIHASHAILGVHGAALTHFLFLRPGSVLIQVVPIGTQWLSDTYFGKPARVLGLEYVEYEIKPEESSLAERYGANDLMLKNPRAFTEGNWRDTLVYLTQNVKLDMIRFERYLKDAYDKAKNFMDKGS